MAKGAPAADTLIDDVVTTREQLRERARETLGVSGSTEPTPPLRKPLREHGLSLYPAYALSVLLFVDTFQ